MDTKPLAIAIVVSTLIFVFSNRYEIFTTSHSISAYKLNKLTGETTMLRINRSRKVTNKD